MRSNHIREFNELMKQLQLMSQLEINFEFLNKFSKTKTNYKLEVGAVQSVVSKPIIENDKKRILIYFK